MTLDALCERALRDAGHDVPVHPHLEVGLVLSGGAPADLERLTRALGLRGPCTRLVAADGDRDARARHLAQDWLDEGVATALLLASETAAVLLQTTAAARALEP